MQVKDVVNHFHGITLNHLPTSLEERTVEAVGARRLVLRHLHNGISDLLLCYRVSKGREVALREVYALPILTMHPSLALVQQGREVLLGQLLFLIMMHHIFD